MYLEDESEESKQKRKEQYEKDRQAFEAIDKQTKELVKNMAVLKKVDEMNQPIIEMQEQMRKNRKWVDREEDLELKQKYEQQKQRVSNLHEELAGKIEGQINLDFHGNISFQPAGDKKGEDLKKKGEEAKKTGGI